MSPSRRSKSTKKSTLRAADSRFETAAVTFQRLRARRGNLTTPQLVKLTRLFGDDAEALYDLANRIERKRAPGPSLKRPLDVLTRRIVMQGFGEDSVAIAAVKFVSDVGIAEPRTPAELRTVAGAMTNAAEWVHATFGDYNQFDKRTGRRTRRNVALDWFLDHVKQFGFSDGEIARRLYAMGIEPDGPGSEANPIHRWRAVIKSARARRRRKAREAGAT